MNSTAQKEENVSGEIGAKAEVRGYCPICGNVHPVEKTEPAFSDDPLLEEEDFFKMAGHEDPATRTACGGVGKSPRPLVSGAGAWDGYTDNSGRMGPHQD